MNKQRNNNNNNEPFERNWIAAQNNALRINHIQARIDKKHRNSQCRLCGDRGETINLIISECSKLPEIEYKTRHVHGDLLGNVQESEKND